MKALFRMILIFSLIPIIGMAQTGSKAGFSFHWAFTNYCLKNINIRYENNGMAVVITTNANNNNFPEALKSKTFPPAREFIYSKTTNIPKRNYAFVYVDGTQKLEDVIALHNMLPTDILMFIHRPVDEKKNEPQLLEILKQRPAWLYYGNPYEPNASMTRSGKDVFFDHNISLNKDVPGGN